MKKKLLYIVLVWLAGIGAALGQVTGRVFLDGKTDHSGVKVKFVAQTLSAKTDSTFSLADGSYTKSLKQGNYLVEISAVDYKPIRYNNGNVFQYLNSIILDNSTLYVLSNYLSGTVSGVLKKGSLYIVDGDINVPSGDTLTIESGTRIFVNDDVSINIQGYLKAKGTITDSIFVQSSSRLNAKTSTYSKWSGIGFGIENGAGEISYARLTDADRLLSVSASSMNYITKNALLISNCVIEHCYKVLFFQANVIFKNNKVTKCGIIFDSRFLTIPLPRNVEIVCNYLESYKSTNNNYAVFAIEQADSVVISNNIIDVSKTELEQYYENAYTHYEEIAPSSYFLKVTNNYIKGDYGFSTARYASFNSTFSNNTFEGSTTIRLRLFGHPSPDFVNNIFWGDVDFSLSPEKFNSNIFRAKTNVPNVLGFGQKITTNANGDSVDTYFNLFEDPKFLNGSAPYLAANSPAIGAGIDANGNPVNIGFDPTGTCLENYFTKPNPVITADTLSITGLVHQGSGLLSDGVVMAVEKASGKARYQKVSNGVFKLDSLRKSEYILYAIPNPVTVTGYLPTYYVNKVKLNEATPLNLLGKIKDVDIYLVAKPSVASGNYAIQGRFSYADNNTDDTTVFGKSWFSTSYTPASPIVITENPCKNLPVVLYNSNNQLIQSTVTDLDGYFVFNNLTSGTYKAQGQRVNYTTEKNGLVEVGSTSTTKANLRLEQVVSGLESENAENMNSVIAYPNPFKSELQLKGYKGAVSIHDLTGNLYFETTINENETIDASNWPSGFYLLKTGNKVQKIVKQD